VSADGSVWPTLIGWLFLITNAGRLLAYFPQIIAAARCDAGARSVSVVTWGYFAIAHLSALMYAIAVLKDSRSIWIFSGNLVVTLILVAIVLIKRRRHLAATGSGKILHLPPARQRLQRKRQERPMPRNGRYLVVTRPGDVAPPGSRSDGKAEKIVMRNGLQAVTLRASR